MGIRYHLKTALAVLVSLHALQQTHLHYNAIKGMKLRNDGISKSSIVLPDVTVEGVSEAGKSSESVDRHIVRRLASDHSEDNDQRNSCQCVHCESDKQCGGLWSGRRSSLNDDIDKALDFAKLTLVISHCKHDLAWLQKFTEGYQISEVLVFSKCGQDVESPLLNTKVVRLPNVGRCDHTYAYYMNQMYNETSTVDEVILFLKDDADLENIRTGHMRTMQDMLRDARGQGFGCGLEPQIRPDYALSSYHATDILMTFRMHDYERGRTKYTAEESNIEPFESSYNTLQDFVQAMNYSFPNKLTLVCYGGWFASTRQAIQKQPQNVWQNLEQSLSRANNLEEGHFAERSWGGLLAERLEDYEIEALINYSSRFLQVGEWLKGPLAVAV